MYCVVRYQQARIQQEQELLVRLHKERRQAERDDRNASMVMENEFAVEEENAKSVVENVVEEDSANKKVGSVFCLSVYIRVPVVCLCICSWYAFTMLIIGRGLWRGGAGIY